jgi:predicted transcriptional regulator
VLVLVRYIRKSRSGNRKKLEIIRDILLVVADSGEDGSRKTHIMYGANLSYVLLTRYLNDALKAGLVNEENSDYFITEKGKVFLETYEDYSRKKTDIEKRTVYLTNGIKKTLEQLIVS